MVISWVCCWFSCFACCQNVVWCIRMSVFHLCVCIFMAVDNITQVPVVQTLLWGWIRYCGHQRNTAHSITFMVEAAGRGFVHSHFWFDFFSLSNVQWCVCVCIIAFYCLTSVAFLVMAKESQCEGSNVSSCTSRWIKKGWRSMTDCTGWHQQGHLDSPKFCANHNTRSGGTG